MSPLFRCAVSSAALAESWCAASSTTAKDGSRFPRSNVRCSFAAAFALVVLRPLDAPVRELDRRGVHRVYAAHPELRERALVPRVGERGVLPGEHPVHEPEELLHHCGVARPVRMGKGRELHGLDAAYAPELPGEYRREVDELVEGEHVRELAEHQQVRLRGVGELPGLDFLVGRESLDFGVAR